MNIGVGKLYQQVLSKTRKLLHQRCEFLRESWLLHETETQTYISDHQLGLGSSWFLSSSLSPGSPSAHSSESPWQRSHWRGLLDLPTWLTDSQCLPDHTTIQSSFMGMSKQHLQQYVMICGKCHLRIAKQYNCIAEMKFSGGWGEEALYSAFCFVLFLFLTNCTFTATTTWECVDFPSF